MAKKTTTEHTPSYMTQLMAKLLGINLEQFDNYSQAYLVIMPGYINGPVWCMDLVLDNRTERAIYEEVDKYLYPYKGVIDPIRIEDTDHQWKRTITRDGQAVRQRSELYFNQKKEMCLRWLDD